MPRNPVYCCLRAMSGDNLHCQKRLDGKAKKCKLGTGDFRLKFDTYVGDSAHLFNSEDSLCESCRLKVRNAELARKASESRKRQHDPVSDTPMKLRSRTLSLPVLNQDSQENRMEVNDDRVAEDIGTIDVEVAGPSSHTMFSDLEAYSNSFDLEDQNARAAEEYFDTASDSTSGQAGAMLPPSVPSMESQVSDFSQSLYDSQNSNFQEVPSESSFSQAISVASTFSIRRLSSPVRRGEVPFILPGISSVPRSESRCVVCKSRNGRSRIPNSALLHLWVNAKILVPENNRTCSIHLECGVFKSEAMEQIMATKDYAAVTGQEAAKWMLKLAEKLAQRHKPVDFNPGSGLGEDDYKLLTGIGQVPFQELVDFLRDSNMRESSNRSLRNALAMFLVMLRLNLSQRVIAFMFGVNSQSCVSDTITAVSDVLLEKFVPLHLGYRHKTREEFMEQHMRSTFTTILQRDPKDMIAVLDGTYLFSEKSSNQYLQRRSWSNHKKQNLFKPMMVIFPDGYQLEAEGLYFSDGLNNDAKILEDMWRKPESIRSILQEGDCLVLDRGFRDVIDKIEESGVVTFMPHCLKKGQKQFSAEQANESRKITKLRWVVEAANGRLKGVFSFFHETISAGYFKQLNKFFRITVAIINAYFPPLFNETEDHILMADSIHQSSSKVNRVQEKVQELRLDKVRKPWIPANEDSCLEFPQLTMTALEAITLGKYQLKMGALYNIAHTDSRTGYRFYVHKDLPGLLRIRMKSRFSKRQKHLLWVEFEEFRNGQEAIKGYYCKCQSGARTIGCCSHIAAVLRYLGHDRFIQLPERPDYSSWFLDAAEALAEDSDDEDSADDYEEEEEDEDVEESD